MIDPCDSLVPGSDVLIRAENVSKKFCRSLKRSLWYGAQDILTALNPWSPENGASGPSGLQLRRDEFLAVNDVSFELRRGECLGLVGHNGAGKSTLLKILNGLIPPDSGRITVRGRVAALIELNAGFNPILTGRENIYNQAALLGFTPGETEERFQRIIDFAEIGDFLDMPVQNYSSGMRVRLGFAIAAQMEPDVLIIDEVLAVGDVAFRFKCMNAIGDLMRTSAVIFVSHSMPQIFRLCTEIIVLDHANVTYQGADVSEGVSIYLSLLKEAPSTITGSGEVRLRHLELQAEGSLAEMAGTLRVNYGASVTLKAQLEASDQIADGRVQFVLWNAEMLPVMDVMTGSLTGFDLGFPASGVVEVTAVIPRLELNGGKYSLSVVAASQDYLRTYCRHDNAAYLQVTAPTASGAHVLAVADWTTASISSS